MKRMMELAGTVCGALASMLAASLLLWAVAAVWAQIAALWGWS